MCTPGDLGLVHVIPPGKTAYNAETYVHNWYEETVRNTIKREEFVKKRECEELSIQKSQIMVDLLLKPVELTARQNGFLYFGDVIQLISPGPDCPTAVQAYPFKKLCSLGQLALSASVPPNVIDYKQFLDTDSIITCSPHLYPVVRNSFVIERPDCPDDDTTRLHYGDTFRIRALPTQHFTLYLHSAPALPLHAAAPHSAKPLVRFSDTANPNTLWRVVPLDPLLKIKMEIGSIPIPMKTRLLIQHALSGHNLSLAPDYPALTYFGDEFEASVHTKFDRTRRNPTWANHWSFSTERGWRKPDREVMEQAKFSASINTNDVNQSASETGKGLREDDNNEQSNDLCTQYEPPCLPEQPVEEFAREQLSSQMEAMRLDTGVPGHVLPYDYRTAPQPHAHAYRLSEHQEFYPNKKWNCPDPAWCCNPRPSVPEEIPPCVPQKDCYDMGNDNNKPPVNWRKFY